MTRTPVLSLDLTRPLADITFSGAQARLVAEGPAAQDALDQAPLAGAALLVSEQVGLAEHRLDSRTAYLKTRHQFGRPVGSFHVVKHRLAALWVTITQARAAASRVATSLATAAPDTPIATAVAQFFGSTTAVRAAEECVQIHGGLGFTWEHHRARLSVLAGLPQPG